MLLALRLPFAPRRLAARMSSQLARQIASHNPGLRDPDALAATALLLQRISAARPAPIFDTRTLVLRPASAEDNTPPELAPFTQLVSDEQDKAFSQGYSSALLGQGNEADDTSDIAFWVPAPASDSESADDGAAAASDTILKGLGLEDVYEECETSPSQVLLPDCTRVLLTGLPDARVLVLEARRLAGGWAGIIGVGVWS